MAIFPQVPLVSDRTTLEACQGAAGCVKKRSVSFCLSLEKTHLYKQCLPAISWTAPSQMCAHTHADSLNHAHTHTHNHTDSLLHTDTYTHLLTLAHTLTLVSTSLMFVLAQGNTWSLACRRDCCYSEYKDWHTATLSIS